MKNSRAFCAQVIITSEKQIMNMVSTGTFPFTALVTDIPEPAFGLKLICAINESSPRNVASTNEIMA